MNVGARNMRRSTWNKRMMKWGGESFLSGVALKPTGNVHSIMFSDAKTMSVKITSSIYAI